MTRIIRVESCGACLCCGWATATRALCRATIPCHPLTKREVAAALEGEPMPDWCPLEEVSDDVE
jgi:hypothetical protein